MPINILGISCYYHDSAACLVVDGKVIAAAQEERFTRKKHDPTFPFNSIKFCLSFGGLRADEIDYVVFYDKPFLKFERLLETYLAFAPSGLTSFIASFPIWIKDKLFQKINICKSLEENIDGSVNWSKKLLFSEHHLSHAASAFYPSPFDSAAIITMDGVGEWATASIGIGDKNQITLQKEIRFPHSLGLLYSAFTYYAGFKVNSGEYKLMGLAPYGRPIYTDLIKNNLIDIREDGSFSLNISFFGYCTDLKMVNKKFATLFGGPPRKPESELTQKEMDLAASIQEVTEEVVLRIARNVSITTGMKNLCLAGGVALNCVANGKLLSEGIFDNIWIQPASGDAGGSIGAALAIYYLMLGKSREINGKELDGMRGSYLGPEYTNREIESQLIKCEAKFKFLDDHQITEATANALAMGQTVGWINGRMEFGPRSLGARSILADPRNPSMQKNLNLAIKFRESFRPFAPSVLREDVSEWFNLGCSSMYMLLVAKVSESKRMKIEEDETNLFGMEKLNLIRSQIPSVTHIDYSARVQTVHKETNHKYYNLMKRFKEITGCPVLINTSFNIRGEPIVSSPTDAFKCFMGNGLDILVIGNYYLEKNAQPLGLRDFYTSNYELD